MAVRDSGNPLLAQLMLIGEAPGADEERDGIPFVGASGQRLFGGWRGPGWLPRLGLTREMFVVTNVLDYKPRNIDKVPRTEMEYRFDLLETKVASMPRLRIICPTGNYALYAITQKGKVSWHQRDGRSDRPGISKWRGSILSYVDQKGRTLTVIPTIHPAATFARGKAAGKQAERYHYVCREIDWPRIAMVLRVLRDS